jgi:hypothetical protein
LEDANDVKMTGADGYLSSLADEETEESRQALLLILESGDALVLLLRHTMDGRLEFVTTYQECYAPEDLLMAPGHHLAIDPSSRYAAAGCVHGMFFLYHLETVEALHRQADEGKQLVPVLSYRPRSVKGVIHQMVFLHPAQGRRDHILLLLILVRKCTSRMVVYEWKAGDDVENVLTESRVDHKIWKQDSLPLFVVPLTVDSSFLTVASDAIGTCRGVLEASPKFEVFDITAAPPSRHHLGSTAPLWTAWTRPVRLPGYSRGKDCIYLAREDGYVLFLDLAKTVEGSIPFQQFDCSIYTGFCSIFEKSSDILIIAGNDGPGQLWKVSWLLHTTINASACFL